MCVVVLSTKEKLKAIFEGRITDSDDDESGDDGVNQVLEFDMDGVDDPAAV